MNQINAIFDNLDAREIDYVIARAKTKSDREACKEAGVSRGWLSKRDAHDLFERAMTFKADVAYRAQSILNEALEEAALVKANGLKSRDERIKQAASTEILDRHFGKPPQKQEISGKEGGPVTLRVVYDTKESPKE